MTPLNKLNFKFKNTPNDYHLRKVMGILHREDLIVLCRDNQEFSNGQIVVRPDAVIWQRGTNKFTVVEFKSRFLHGDNYSLYEYFQTIIEAEVVKNVLEADQDVEVESLLFYGNGRTISFATIDENIFTVYDALDEMDEPYPVAGSKIAAHIVLSVPNNDETIMYDPDARERGIIMHEWLLNPGKE